MLELVDTAGMEQFTHLRDPHIKRGDGFILVYSIVDPTTFEDVKTVRAQIVQAKFRYLKKTFIILAVFRRSV